MFSKPFSKELHTQYDEPARARVRELFQVSKYVRAVEPKDVYTVDFELFRGTQRIGGLEVEVKDCWDHPHFPYDTLHFLQRKIHYGNVLWVVFAPNLKWHYTVPISVVRSCPQIRKPNIFSQGNPETFYEIPIKACKLQGLERLIKQWNNLTSRSQVVG